ncbi:glycosyltransferase [Providencia rettgeri]|uniref:glycosyltransferase family 2 protein n=1 Tax=Providencia rettgeri TaxID=587 RepID=UPI001B3798F8|nr:glycosyltransferase family 2 protein [Providencia rettgeri]ELT5687368.1 glycosyltransferase [Providencia rettgeri]MBQ0210955.1 glycosyltransferase [Providencia rettgeri]
MFSLILCTINRQNEIEQFIDSIVSSTIKIELIIVDQNKDNLIDDIIEKYKNLKDIVLIHVKTDKKGLSRARNLGLNYATQEFVAFPDDDCFYESNLLEKVSDIFAKNREIEFISVKTVDPECNDRSLINCSSMSHKITLDIKAGCSFTYFFRNNAKFKSLKFSEEMGVGAGTPYGAGEETDFITKLVFSGAKGQYFPDVTVYHEAKEATYSKDTLKRLVSYGGGYGYYIRKNKDLIGTIRALKLLGAPFIRLIFRSKNKNQFVSSLYFLKGFFIGLFK